MKQPIKFGKYYLLERINVGGMAEVFRAKAYGVEGFERLVAVKRILPNIAEDKEFIRMFVDEAKIAVQLTHANIAQIFDLGVEEASYYIALEHIHGRDLRAIFDRCRSQGEPMPVAQAAFITMKVCEGLDYAHNKRDQSGREIGLVHRDVSPQNILVSFEGEVKIIDFGIAKAAGKGSKTQAGILKGKFGYMSPEQVRGLPIDRRSDVFSCGIVLYELLTGERLFIGESDFSTLEKVRNVEILPPSTYNRKIAPELERIVLKALAKDVEDRYHNAIDLHDELQAFVYTAGEFYSRKDLAAWMKPTFAREIEEETAKLEAYRQLVPPPESQTHGGVSVSRRRETVSLGDASLPGGPRTLPPPLPGQGPRRTQSMGSVPPPAPPRAQSVAAAPSIAAAPSPGLEWDEDELETSIYDEEARGVRPPTHAGGSPSGLATSRADGEPDLSSLVNTARGWDGPDTVQDQAAAAEPDRVADGSNRTKSPLSGSLRPAEVDPSAVVRLANMNAGQHAGDPRGLDPRGLDPRSLDPRSLDPRSVDPRSVDPASTFGSTFVSPDRRSKAGVFLALGGAALLVGGGILAVLLITRDGGKETAAATPEIAAESTEAKAGTEAVPAVIDPNTGFDLIVDPAGVIVKLDGRTIGKAPLQIRNLGEGDHFVEIEAPPGFFNKTQSVDVVRGTAERVVIELDAMDIVGKFESEPTGAQVTLVSDGHRQVIDKTPVEVKLDPRKRYEVVFEKSGFVTVTRPVEITGVPEVEVSVELERGRVAAVDRSRSGRQREQAPPPEREVAPDRTGVGSAGGAPDEVAAVVKTTPEPKPEPETTVAAAKGTLMLGSKPPCRIFIDGRDTGKSTPQRDLALPSGRHRITLVNNDLGIKESFTVKIKPGETTKSIKDLTSRITP